jgi:transcriptional regulator with XRE-family HTH domain
MKLAELRRRVGMSQAELAEKIGKTPGAVGNYESGTRIPRLPTLRKIAKVLGVNVGDIEFPAETDEQAATIDDPTGCITAA